MELALDADERFLVSVMSFARERLAPAAAAVDEACLYPTEGLEGLASLGLLGMLFPREFGGLGASTVDYATAVREVAYACASTSVSMLVTNMVGGAIFRHGSDAQRRRYLPDLAAGRGAGAFALSEPAGGSDAGALRTTAVRDGGAYVLDGEKTFITNGAHARVVLVMAVMTGDAAETEGAAVATAGGRGRHERTRGISAFLVEPGTPGFSVGRSERKTGLRGSDTVSLAFQGCRVPVESRLGAPGEGFRIAMGALDGGRIGVASQAIGIAQAALAAALSYLQGRTTSGDNGLAQTVQCLLAGSATDLDAAQLLVYRAARLRDQGRPYTREASMAKLFAAEAANRACLKAVQALGLDGCLRSYPVERHLRDVKVTTIYEGTSEVQRLVIARSLLRS